MITNTCPTSVLQRLVATLGVAAFVQASSAGCLAAEEPATSAYTLTSASELMWQLAYDVNKPNDPNRRGAPDASRPFENRDGPRVWETFKTSDQIFLKGAEDPGPWETPFTEVKFLTATSKVPNTPEFHTVAQAVRGTLTDQHGNLVYYEKAMNQVAYDYVREKRLYDSKTFRTDITVKFPDDSVMVKSAWRIMTSHDEPSRYLTRTVMISRQPASPLEQVTVGLVGWHLVAKKRNAPQWVWATFEHLDNVKDDAPNQGEKYSFFNPACTDCVVNTSTEVDGQPSGKPTQVKRLEQISPEVKASNERWLPKLGNSSWRFYRMIGVQYPSRPHDAGAPDGVPQPFSVRNTTLETYLTTETSSCMNCHSTAGFGGNRKVDYTFMLFEAKSSEGQNP